MLFKIIDHAPDRGITQLVFLDQAEMIAHCGRVGFRRHGSLHRAGLRDDLQGQPRFTGLYGPMYDGETAAGEVMIRYETSEAYRVYSSRVGSVEDGEPLSTSIGSGSGGSGAGPVSP